MNDFSINKGIPVILYSNLLAFRVSNKSFNLRGELLRNDD